MRIKCENGLPYSAANINATFDLLMMMMIDDQQS